MIAAHGESILKLCFKDQPLDYTIRKKTIIVKPKAAALPPASQAITVKGKVTNENNEPLPGVSIGIKGTAKGTTTDAGGSYILSVPDGNATLVFTFIGYTSQEVPVNNRTTLDIQLTE